jgi:hypothetical protein
MQRKKLLASKKEPSELGKQFIGRKTEIRPGSLQASNSKD